MSQPDHKTQPGQEDGDTDKGVRGQVNIRLEQLELEIVHLPPAKIALCQVQDHALLGFLEGLENLGPNRLFPFIPPDALIDQAPLADGFHQAIINAGN